MKKFLKWLLIVVGALLIIGFIGMRILTSNTKKHSPEEIVKFEERGYDIEVFYCRPYKKEREIFGGLVPYGEVWRTGANEPTTVSTSTDLDIMGKTLPAGKYSLWTIPGPKRWEVIFNNGEYDWGVSWGGKASRDSAFDVVNVTIPVQRNFKVLEQFTIELEGDPLLMKMGWDYTRVDVPIEKAE